LGLGAAYIGGDSYSSSVIYHSEQGSATTNQYLYLHRDYLGSILAITDTAERLKRPTVWPFSDARDGAAGVILGKKGILMLGRAER